MLQRLRYVYFGCKVQFSAYKIFIHKQDKQESSLDIRKSHKYTVKDSSFKCKE